VGIDFTFDAERHLYLIQGKPVPSVTQVLHSAGLSADYSMVAPEVLERKRIIGEYVHKATQYLDEGCLDLETVDPEIQGYLTGYEKFIRESGFGQTWSNAGWLAGSTACSVAGRLTAQGRWLASCGSLT